MADIEEIGKQIATDLEAAGWSIWADTSMPEPFDVWLTPPGVPSFTGIKHTNPAELVRELDGFNDPEARLTDDEIVGAANHVADYWIAGSVARALTVEDGHDDFPLDLIGPDDSDIPPGVMVEVQGPNPIPTGDRARTSTENYAAGGPPTNTRSNAVLKAIRARKDREGGSIDLGRVWHADTEPTSTYET